MTKIEEVIKSMMWVGWEQQPGFLVNWEEALSRFAEGANHGSRSWS